jgi:pimeloyl-ACP methyl ester carboxylesterase
VLVIDDEVAVREALVDTLTDDGHTVIQAGSGKEALARLADGARVDVVAGVRRLETPTLIVCGARDRLNLRLSRELASLLPNAELHVIPGAGHVANLEQPALFTQALRRFLDDD